MEARARERERGKKNLFSPEVEDTDETKSVWG